MKVLLLSAAGLVTTTGSVVMGAPGASDYPESGYEDLLPKKNPSAVKSASSYPTGVGGVAGPTGYKEGGIEPSSSGAPSYGGSESHSDSFSQPSSQGSSTSKYPAMPSPPYKDSNVVVPNQVKDASVCEITTTTETATNTQTMTVTETTTETESYEITCTEYYPVDRIVEKPVTIVVETPKYVTIVDHECQIQPTPIPEGSCAMPASVSPDDDELFGDSIHKYPQIIDEECEDEVESYEQGVKGAFAVPPGKKTFSGSGSQPYNSTNYNTTTTKPSSFPTGDRNPSPYSGGTTPANTSPYSTIPSPRSPQSDDKSPSPYSSSPSGGSYNSTKPSLSGGHGSLHYDSNYTSPLTGVGGGTPYHGRVGSTNPGTPSSYPQSPYSDGPSGEDCDDDPLDALSGGTIIPGQRGDNNRVSPDSSAYPEQAPLAPAAPTNKTTPYTILTSPNSPLYSDLSPPQDEDCSDEEDEYDDDSYNQASPQSLSPTSTSAYETDTDSDDEYAKDDGGYDQLRPVSVQDAYDMTIPSGDLYNSLDKSDSYDSDLALPEY